MAKVEGDFIPIRVSTLRGDLKIPFDVYVYVADHHVHYCRSGDSFEGARLERLKAKKLKKMFIRKDDEIPYRQYLEQSVDTAYGDNNRDMQTRAEVIQGFQQAMAEDYMEDPTNRFSYDLARGSVQRFAEFLEKYPDGVKALLNMKNVDHSISQHGVTVATLSVAMALDEGLCAGQTLHLLALGSLIHDIEHIFSDLNLARPLTEFTPEEMAIYQAHPTRGAHRLQGAEFVDNLVIKIITQHEENINGGGFPQGLLEKDMDPLVLCVGTANAYDRLVSFEHLKMKDALRTLLIEKLGAFPLKRLQSLQKVLKKHELI